MAHLKSEHLTELRHLHGQASAIIRWLEHNGHLDQFRELMSGALDDALARQDLRGMRMASRDIRGLLRALPSGSYDALLRELRGEGFALEYDEQLDTATALAIVGRGLVRNDGEYHLLRAHLDNLAPDSPDARSVHRLLDSYRVR